MFRVTIVYPDRRTGGTFPDADAVRDYLRQRVLTVRTEPGEYATVNPAGFRPRPVRVRIERVADDA